MCATATAVYAQETTASIRGQVVDENGAPVAGATVTVTHVPTGASLTSVTGQDGFYSARGLRVGGPYRIAVTGAGFQAAARTLQSAGVGEPANVDLTMSHTSAVATELVVTAAAAAKPTNGPNTSFTAADVQELPSVSRDIKDLARLDPFATLDPSNQNALSFAGVNTRFNQLTVDGVRQNDDFGLNNNGYPSQRQPFSMDIIQAISVSAAPYSVVNNGFTGGQLNVVTKSGTNEFHGSAFYDKSGQDYRGHKAKGVNFSTAFDEKDWGATLGGPIIKDRLFFFLGYEKYEGTLGFDTGPVGSNLAVVIPRITTQALDAFRQQAKSIYGYDPGTYVTGPFPVSDEKKFAKLDWQINDDHRLTLTYQNDLGNSFNGSVTSSFANGNSTTQPRVGLTTNQYNKVEELTTYTAQLNSNWTENLSTELRYNYKETDSQQNPLGGLSVGQVTVNVADLPGVATGAGTPQIQFGADTFRHDNYLNVKVDTLEAIARYHTGPHEFTVGARTEEDRIFNVFVSNSLGGYSFASYADFLARRASGFSLTGGVDPSAGTVPATLGTARKGAADFSYRLSSVYGEDRLEINRDLNVTAGVRVDWYNMSDKPTLNTAFVSRNGFTNQENLDGKSVVLPRVGFNWTPLDRLSVSGGFGRFSSTGLNVWISNAFSNNGVNQTNAICPAGPYTNVDLTKAPAGCTFTPGNGNTNALAPSFQIPTVWKGNLRVAYRFDLGRFGDDWLVQGDYLQQNNENALYWVDARAQAIGLAPDGRPVYGRSAIGQTTGNDYDFLLANSDKGGSHSYAFTLAKSWRDGWADGLSARFTYTNTRATDVNPMTSSIAQSSYTRFATMAANAQIKARSDYEIRDKYDFGLNYEHKFFGDNSTRISLVAQHRTGLPFSYTYANSRTGNFDNDFGQNVSTYSGRQATSNSLMYVPTVGDTKVVYAAGFDVAAFQSFLQSSGLAKYAGGIAPRNAFNNPKVTTVDLHVSQELPAFIPNGAKLELFADLMNLGNLINNKWGVLEQYDFYRGVPVVDVSCVGAASLSPTSCATPGARYLYKGTGVGGAWKNPVSPFVVPSASLWQVKFGVRYKF